MYILQEQCSAGISTDCHIDDHLDSRHPIRQPPRVRHSVGLRGAGHRRGEVDCGRGSLQGRIWARYTEAALLTESRWKQFGESNGGV